MRQDGNVTAPKRCSRLTVCGCVVLLPIIVYLSVTSSWTNLHLTVSLAAVVSKVDNVVTSNNTSIPDTRSVPSNLSDGLTVVTAFFDIGGFQKGNGGSQFTPRLYRDWARVFARLESPTIIYVDSEDFRRYFAELRALHLPANLTFIRQLDRRQKYGTSVVTCNCGKRKPT